MNNNNNPNYRNDTRDDQTQKRVIDVIDRRTKNQSATGGRGPRANVTDDSPIHEKISLGRRSSRRNVARNTNESPREDFPPLEGKRVTRTHTTVRTPERISRRNVLETKRSQHYGRELNRYNGNELANRASTRWRTLGKIQKTGKGPKAQASHQQTTRT